MTPLIVNLLQVSLIMSLAAAALHLITNVFSNSLSPKWKYYLWGIVLISFLVPFRPRLSGPVATIDSPSASQIGTGMETVDTGMDRSSIADSTLSVWLQTYLPTLLMGIWIAGIVIFLCVILIKHLRFMRIARRWGEKLDDPAALIIVNNTKKEMNIRSHIDIVRSKTVSVPMMAGIFKPVLFLPEYSLDEEELKYVIRHELIHYRKFDIFVKLMSVLANAVHWFNPLVYKMQKWIYTDCEIACDYEVTRAYDQEEKIRYVETIIGVAKYEIKHKTVFSTNFYSGKNTMKKRFESVLETYKMRIALVVIIVTALVTISMAAGSALAVNTSQEKLPAAVSSEVPTESGIVSSQSSSDASIKSNDNNSGSDSDSDTAHISGDSGLIGVSEAKSVALNKTGGGTVTECELDTDNGVQKYEIKVVRSNYEYEIEIDAKTGKILKYEKEKIDHDDGHDNDHDDDHHDD